MGHQVLWTPTASLVQELLAAKRDLRLPQLPAKLDRYVCVFLDDVGYVQHGRDEMEVLFTFLAPDVPTGPRSWCRVGGLRPQSGVTKAEIAVALPAGSLRAPLSMLAALRCNAEVARCPSCPRRIFA